MTRRWTSEEAIPLPPGPVELGRGALLFEPSTVTVFAGHVAFRLAKPKTLGVRDAILLPGFYFAFLPFRPGPFAA